MNIDFEIIKLLNAYANHSPAFDSLVKMISLNHLLKGAFFILLFWYLWFHQKEQIYKRKRILAGLLASLITMATTIVLTRVLPIRLRPRFNPGLEFVIPGESEMSWLEEHNSFPSDHAALFFSLSTTIFFINRRLGIISFVYTLLFISLPRIYLGLHYPSDILAGGLLGILITLLIQKRSYFSRSTEWLMGYEQKSPALFYMAFFVFSYQVANLFEEVRACLRCAVNLVAS